MHITLRMLDLVTAGLKRVTSMRATLSQNDEFHLLHRDTCDFPKRGAGHSNIGEKYLAKKDNRVWRESPRDTSDGTTWQATAGGGESYGCSFKRVIGTGFQDLTTTSPGLLKLSRVNRADYPGCSPWGANAACARACIFTLRHIADERTTTKMSSGIAICACFSPRGHVWGERVALINEWVGRGYRQSA